jgi:hypothetical protein
MKHIARVAAAGGVLTVILVGAPAFAQVDLSGEWAQVRGEDNTGNPELGDWVGIPMNDASRLRSSAWMRRSTRCPSGSAVRTEARTSRATVAAQDLEDVDPCHGDDGVAFEWLRSVDRPIYMDGLHPSPNAAHTWAGFSTR